MRIKLYFTPRTRAERVRWLLDELELDYELININLFDGEGQTDKYKMIHPLGCVPVLDVDGELMFESGAICDWLTDLHADKQLAPAIDSIERIKYKQWYYFVIATMEPFAWSIVLNKFILPVEERLPEVVITAEKNYIKTLEIIERELEGKDFLIGNRFTTADIMLTTLLSWLPKKVRPFINTYTYMKKMTNRDKFRQIVK
ncbi:MAG: glutathione S-transferase [endosymbiont of Galathealinum brachiosum]|uniref:Glutathione S-transferase n=1 Tax=endosymbiont of Galathealinum brachiosum TaxID=2200906 RepID=A0A370DID6_9GAMM|nr:MAG: glutathione S-transferase [endosymbiont of Galathealinum brachiosum]